MDIQEKIKILTDAAKYDVSCSSSGSNRKNKNGLGDASFSGICHSWSEDGRCISILKILLTNKCIYNCNYCINRRDNDVVRAEFTPREVADLTINFYKRNYTAVMASNLSMDRDPVFTPFIMPSSSDTGMKAPLNPPTLVLAIMPPFFTASFNRARAAVVPW